MSLLLILNAKKNPTKYGVAILPPIDLFESYRLLIESSIHVTTTIFDSWYNKGFVGALPDSECDSFTSGLLSNSAELSDIIYL